MQSDVAQEQNSFGRPLNLRNLCNLRIDVSSVPTAVSLRLR